MQLENIQIYIYLYFNNIFKRVKIVYYVPRRIMRIITRQATMLAGDRTQGKVEA